MSLFSFVKIDRPRHDRQPQQNRQRQDTTQSEASLSRQVRITTSKREQRG